MRKLTLEALHVESFETTPAAPRLRGTIHGNLDDAGTTTQPGTRVSVCAVCEQWTDAPVCGIDTYNVQDCGETNVFDCTLGGCTANTCDPHFNTCDGYCAIEYTARCVVDTRSV
ncbi:hypothetical protein [Longimicrobium sp.]|uniref:hypothetical protein n=1 Tax=Longimicrobium sp. TaxID=2029185 RepID=UPI003B3BB59B